MSIRSIIWLTSTPVIDSDEPPASFDLDTSWRVITPSDSTVGRPSMCTTMSIRLGGSRVRPASMRSSDDDAPRASRIWNPERWPAFCVTCTS